MKLENVIAVRSNKKIYRDGDFKIKVFDESFTKANVLNEALNQAMIEETGLNVPKITDVKCIDGKWAIVSEFIEGKTLLQLMEENPDREDEYLEKMVDLHIEVVKKPCRIMNRLRDKLTGKIMASELDAVHRFDLCRKILDMPQRTKICHGDFMPANIAVDKDGKMFIIDWSHAAKGNAAADVARTCLLFSLAQRDDLAEKYLDLYCEKNEADKEYVKKWFPIVAAALSVDAKNEKDKEKLLDRVKKSHF